MPETTIPPLQWKLIIDKIQTPERLCVPFLGAGVNATYPGYEGLPLGSEVALRLLEEMLGLDSGDLSRQSPALDFKSLTAYRERTNRAFHELQELLEKNAPPYDPDQLRNILTSILPDDRDDVLAHIITNQNLEQYGEFTRVALQDLARVAL